MNTDQDILKLSNLVRSINNTQHLSMFDDGFLSVIMHDGDKYVALHKKAGNTHVQITRKPDIASLNLYLEGLLEGLQSQIIDL